MIRRFDRHYTYMRVNVGTPGTPESGHCTTWEPPADIYESPDDIYVVVEMPGLSKNKIDLSVQPTAYGGTLNLTAFRPERIPRGANRVHQMEIPYGRFSRSIALPHYAVLDRIEARYERGYLIVVIPKKSGR